MINKSTYLLVCLIEECAEVIHRACKAIRFGMEETQASAYEKLNMTRPDGSNLEHTKTNRRRLQDELTDLRTVTEMMDEENEKDFINFKVNELGRPFSSMSAVQSKELKRAKLRKYMEYSRFLGLLEAEIPRED